MAVGAAFLAAALAGCGGGAPSDLTATAPSSPLGAFYDGNCYLLRVLGTEATPLCEGVAAIRRSPSGEFAATFFVREGPALVFRGNARPGDGETVATIEGIRVGPRATALPPADLAAVGRCTSVGDEEARTLDLYCEATDADGVLSSAFFIGRSH